MQQIIPGVDVPTESFQSHGVRDGEAGSGGLAETSLQLRNRFTVSEVARDANTQTADEQALLRAFNALWAIEEYQRRIEQQGSTEQQL
jgi:hypothetical protein